MRRGFGPSKACLVPLSRVGVAGRDGVAAQPARREAHRVHAHDELHRRLPRPRHVVPDARRLLRVAPRVGDGDEAAGAVVHPRDALLGDRHEGLRVDRLVLVVHLEVGRADAAVEGVLQQLRVEEARRVHERRDAAAELAVDELEDARHGRLARHRVGEIAADGERARACGFQLLDRRRRERLVAAVREHKVLCAGCRQTLRGRQTDAAGAAGDHRRAERGGRRGAGGDGEHRKEYAAPRPRNSCCAQALVSKTIVARSPTTRSSRSAAAAAAATSARSSGATRHRRPRLRSAARIHP